jgi:NAD(P)-dependent dehydrogenase (short-subunit alcohol dehydrogenase family)
MSQFDLNSVPSHKGKVALVTGANIGLGYETALALAKKDFRVVMACRNEQKAVKAKNDILAHVPHAELDILNLDLSSMKAVRNASAEFLSRYNQLDLLINNAGIMMPPYQKTEDEMESQMAANYFGHFLLTGLLLETLDKSKDSRVVSLSSIAHDWGDIYFDDLHFEKVYSARKAYGQSKLACLMFAYELDSKLKKQNSSTLSVAAHPGVSTTNLGQHMPSFAIKISEIVAPLLFQIPERGALPTLRAALDPAVKGGEYFGPGGFREFKGNPVIVNSNAISKDKVKAQQLWEVSEKLTKFKFPI